MFSLRLMNNILLLDYTQPIHGFAITSVFTFTQLPDDTETHSKNPNQKFH